jgi:lycopene cyclase domain-containing protein
MAICFAFMIPVDGWLTKQSAPIVEYRPEDTSGIRPIWDIPLEEYAYAFALLTLVMLTWDRLGARTAVSSRQEVAA